MTPRLERTTHARTVAAKIAHRVELGLRYGASYRETKRAPRPASSNLRLRDLKRLFGGRWGPTLPDDDAGRGDFEIAAHHLARCRTRPRERIIAFAAEFCPWLATDEAAMIADDIIEKPRAWNAGPLGVELRLTNSERTQLGITTIRAFDMDKAGMDERRRVKHVERQRKNRAAKSSGRPRGRPRLPKSNACAPKVLLTSAAHAFNSAGAFDMNSPAAHAIGRRAVFACIVRAVDDLLLHHNERPRAGGAKRPVRFEYLGGPIEPEMIRLHRSVVQAITGSVTDCHAPTN